MYLATFTLMREIDGVSGVGDLKGVFYVFYHVHTHTKVTFTHARLLTYTRVREHHRERERERERERVAVTRDGAQSCLVITVTCYIKCG